jgi:DNA-binding transcriptional ArsR family regulator
MEPGTITLDRESFKALASEVRVEVLKQLESRRMTVTDLSNTMNLAKPTLLEHLDRLVTAGLVTKMDEGRKWIYYELTKRGRSILHPHQVKIMISLALSFLLVGGGIVALLVAATNVYGGAPSAPLSGGETATPDFWGPLDPPQSRTGDYTFSSGLAAGGPGAWGVVLVLIALLPMVLALWYWRAGQNLIDSVRTQLTS